MCVPAMDVLWLKSYAWTCAPGASRRRAIVFVGCRYDQAMRQHAPEFPTVSIAPLRIVFSISRHCSCAGDFSLDDARLCIVIPVAFPIADRLYLLCSPLPYKRGGRTAFL